MENLVVFFNDHLDYFLLSAIVLSGLFIGKYGEGIRISKTYKVLIASVLISVVVFFIEGCDLKCLPKYLFTYLFATSFYELIVKYILKRINSELV